MEPHKFSFEGLEVYEKARALVSDVYRIQNQFAYIKYFSYLCII